MLAQMRRHAKPVSVWKRARQWAKGLVEWLRDLHRDGFHATMRRRANYKRRVRCARARQERLSRLGSSSGDLMNNSMRDTAR